MSDRSIGIQSRRLCADESVIYLESLLSTGKAKVNEDTRLHNGLYLRGIIYKDTLHLDIRNELHTRVTIQVKWIDLNNMRVRSGGGKVVIGARSITTYASLQVVDTSAVWTYRYDAVVEMPPRAATYQPDDKHASPQSSAASSASTPASSSRSATSSKEPREVERKEIKPNVWLIGTFHPRKLRLSINVANNSGDTIAVHIRFKLTNLTTKSRCLPIAIAAHSSAVYANLTVVDVRVPWNYRYRLRDIPNAKLPPVRHSTLTVSSASNSHQQPMSSPALLQSHQLPHPQHQDHRHTQRRHIDVRAAGASDHSPLPAPLPIPASSPIHHHIEFDEDDTVSISVDADEKTVSPYEAPTARTLHQRAWVSCRCGQTQHLDSCNAHLTADAAGGKVIEKTEIKPHVWIIGTYFDAHRTLLVDVHNKRADPIRLQLVWTRFDNMHLQSGGSGKIFVGSHTHKNYARLVVLSAHRGAQWKYRYKYFIHENAVELDETVERERNRKMIHAEMQRFGHLGMRTDAMTLEALTQACVKNKVRFIDLSFPPTAASLGPTAISPSASTDTANSATDQDTKRAPKPLQLLWKRPREFFGADELFHTAIVPEDIKQGKLADCWFVCSLAALAEQPELVRSLFVLDSRSPVGAYQVRMFKNGLPCIITVDDFFPCLADGRPAYSRNHGPGLWVMVLEKAYAKLHGSYARLCTGFASDALQDLTGCPADTFFFNSPNAWPMLGRFWERLLEWKARGYLLTACSKDNVDEKKTGLAPKHYYTILEAVDAPDCDMLVLKLRNPWGNYENGTNQWSSGSALRTLPASQRERLALSMVSDNEQQQRSSEDGVFWMSSKQFQTYFKNVCVCYWRKDWKQVRASGGFKLDSKTIITSQYRVRVLEDTLFFAAVHQQDQRMAGANPYISLGVLIIDSRERYVVADSGVRFDNMVQAQASRLTRGEYYVIPYTNGYACDEHLDMSGGVHPFTLVLHSTRKVQIEKLPPLELYEIRHTAMFASTKTYGKRYACSPGIALYDWCGKRHFSIGVEMTEQWISDDATITISLVDVSKNVKLVCPSVHTVTITRDNPHAFVNMGIVIDDQAWKYTFSWKVKQQRVVVAAVETSTSTSTSTVIDHNSS
jgi:Calpain family cysteine protease